MQLNQKDLYSQIYILVSHKTIFDKEISLVLNVIIKTQIEIRADNFLTELNQKNNNML